jgi:hypothetical protein
VPPENIVTAANQLPQLFLDSGYQPKTIIANARLADGSILVFEGQNAARHTTVLRLASTPARRKDGKTKPASRASPCRSAVLDSRIPISSVEER